MRKVMEISGSTNKSGMVVQVYNPSYMRGTGKKISSKASPGQQV
jgi:hypothetical protein